MSTTLKNTETEAKTPKTEISETEARDLKIAVVNYCGHIGKTTVVKNLLEPNLVGTNVISVETLNDDGGGSLLRIEGSDFGLLQEELIMNDNLIVDIGASNIGETMRLMEQYHGSHEDFDYFIIPNVPDQKSQIDSCATITALIDLGVEAERIRLVFNKIEKIDNIQEDFEKIIEFAEMSDIAVPSVGIDLSEIYPELRKRKMTIDQLIAIPGLREKARASKDPVEKRQLSKLMATQRLAIKARKNLLSVFEDLDL